jgi:hypothetical protein
MVILLHSIPHFAMLLTWCGETNQSNLHSPIWYLKQSCWMDTIFNEGRTQLLRNIQQIVETSKNTRDICALLTNYSKRRAKSDCDELPGVNGIWLVLMSTTRTEYRLNSRDGSVHIGRSRLQSVLHLSSNRLSILKLWRRAILTGTDLKSSVQNSRIRSSNILTKHSVKEVHQLPTSPLNNSSVSM